MGRSGDELAGGGGDRSRLRASDAEREQVAAVLKAAFTQGRLTRDEFDVRVGQVFASRTYADLDALVADIPAGLTRARPPEAAPELDRKKLIQRGTAMGAGATVVISVAAVVITRHPGVGVIVVPVATFFTTVLIAGLLTIISWALDTAYRRQGEPPPGGRGEAYQRPAQADSTGSLPQIGHEPPHAAEAGRRRLPRSRLASPRPLPDL